MQKSTANWRRSNVDESKRLPHTSHLSQDILLMIEPCNSVSSHRRRVLSMGDVQASLSARRDNHYLEGDLWTNVWHGTMSPRWRLGGSSSASTAETAAIFGLFRRRTASRQGKVFWTYKLRDTYSRSGDGKDQSVLQIFGQIPKVGLSLRFRYDFV